MSVRVHTAQADMLGVSYITDQSRLIELFGDEFDDVPTPVLVIGDDFNGEAWAIVGDEDQLLQLAVDLRFQLVRPDPVEVIRVVFTENDVADIAADNDIPLDQALAIAREAGKYIADTACALAGQQLEDYIVTRQP